MEIKNLKVVELASVLAGPAVGMFFAELGAQVIKVENSTTGGDVTRSWKSQSEEPNNPVSAYYSSINYGKSILQLDLKKDTDYQRCIGLIKDADIVITNFRKESAARLKLDYDTIKGINAHIIYGEINGYKYDSRAAYDAVLQAETGFMSINGESDGLPTKIPLAIIDMFAAHQLKQGLLVALLKRDQAPLHVSVSLEEAALAALTNQASNYLMTGSIPNRMGSLHPNIAPYGEIVRTKDGNEVVLAIGSDSQFRHFCEIIGKPKLGDDEKYSINSRRVINRKDLLIFLQEGVAKMEYEELFEKCSDAHIPIGKINDIGTVLSGKVAKEMILTEEIEGCDTKRIKSAAFSIRK